MIVYGAKSDRPRNCKVGFCPSAKGFASSDITLEQSAGIPQVGTEEMQSRVTIGRVKSAKAHGPSSWASPLAKVFEGQKSRPGREIWHGIYPQHCVDR